MRVLLIRHAVAFERNGRRWPDDGQRPLTPQGMRKFRKAASGLSRLADPVERVLTSPLVRTVQTAEILARIARWPAGLEAPQLAPGQSTEKVLALIRAQDSSSLALVGHEPGLSQLLALAIGGTGSGAAVVLKKGGAACVEFGRLVRPGGAQLLWLATPKLLRALS